MHRIRGDSGDVVTPKYLSRETIMCACGCGKSRLRYDNNSQERLYISGHNMHSRPSEIRAGILSVLKRGPMSPAAMAVAMESPGSSVRATLVRMRGMGLVRRVGPGIWAAA